MTPRGTLQVKLPAGEAAAWAELVQALGLPEMALRLAVRRLHRDVALAQANGQKIADAFAGDLDALESAGRPR